MAAPHPTGSSLLEAREYVRMNRDEGVECPCCGQLAKVYRRTINAGMARTLIEAYRADLARGFIHTPSLPCDSHEASQLSWWGLLEEELVRRPDGGRAGYWRVTDRGVAFVRGAAQVPKYALIYDGDVLGTAGDLVGIRYCLGKRFDYGELMAGFPPPNRSDQLAMLG
jgi:hypothetical protein